jgi:hypothetical protein
MRRRDFLKKGMVADGLVMEENTRHNNEHSLRR